MKPGRVIHIAAVAGLAYWTIHTARMSWIEHAGSIEAVLREEGLMIGMFVVLTGMVLLNPKKWGLPIGLLMLFGCSAIALGLLGKGAATSWWISYLTVIGPNLITAACCISLRWVTFSEQSTVPPPLPSRSGNV